MAWGVSRDPVLARECVCLAPPFSGRIKKERVLRDARETRGEACGPRDASRCRRVIHALRPRNVCRMPRNVCRMMHGLRHLPAPFLRVCVCDV